MLPTVCAAHYKNKWRQYSYNTMQYKGDPRAMLGRAYNLKQMVELYRRL